MSGRLILVRHGETFGNVAHRLDTALPGAELTANGAEQAKRLGRATAVPPGRLVASAALRARQTAELIGGEFGSRPEVVEGIHEIQAGELEGRSDFESIALYRKTFAAWLFGDLAGRIPGGESGAEALDRFMPTIAELAEYLDGGGDDAMVVSHGAMIRLGVVAITDVEPEFAVRNFLSNTESIELSRHDGRWQVERWGQYRAPFDVNLASGRIVPGG